MTTKTTLTILSCWCIYFLLSCSEKPKKVEITEQVQNVKQKINLSYDSSSSNKFKYSDLNEFSIDTLDWEKRKEFYPKIDSLEFFQVYQDASKNYLAQSPNSIDLDFFYSKQKSTRKLIERTFLQQREGEYCDRILYNIYDLKGKLISSFIVASGCGDGGYYETSKGKFLNDSTYVLLSEDNYKTEDVDKLNTITYSKMTTLIKASGKIVQKETLVKTKTE